MKKLLLITVTILSVISAMHAQKAADVLENGIPVEKEKSLFLKYDEGELKVCTGKSLQDVNSPPNFLKLNDSAIYLLRETGINIYMRPLNPLNFSIKQTKTVIPDQINSTASESLNGILAALAGSISKTSDSMVDAPLYGFNSMLEESSTNKNGKGTKEEEIKREKNTLIKQLSGIIDTIEMKLKDDQKAQVASCFKLLKKLDFVEESTTIKELSDIKNSINEIAIYFKAIDALIKRAKESNSSFLKKTNDIVTSFVFDQKLEECQARKVANEKRLIFLKTALELVENYQTEASKGGGESGLKWCIKLGEAHVSEKENTVFDITIFESGYKLSDKDEIVSIESKELLKKTIRFREFQRFVPEVSIGTAFTFFKYNTYGTTSDSTGQQFVAEPISNPVRNLNITTMINFNYYIPNSNWNPMYQVGFGINYGIPTLLTGVGTRIHVNERRIALSFGLAATWVNELDKLKVGDKVSGTADIEKDLKPQFSWPPKSYFGLQYNF